jgi:acyl-coenzyme A synthetase/AMP-(fatty) acid ligase
VLPVGYLWVIGRIDDVVNVSGHRLSTAEVESAIVAHVDVAEAAVIGQHDEDTGQAIVAFVTLQGTIEGDEDTIEGIRGTVAERIGKFARPKRIIWADDLPKTRSGKIAAPAARRDHLARPRGHGPARGPRQGAPGAGGLNAPSLGLLRPCGAPAPRNRRHGG